MLAAFGAAMPDLPESEPKPEAMEHFGDMLVARGKAYRHTGRVARGPLGSPGSAFKKRGQRTVDTLSGEIGRYEEAIRRLIESEAALAAKYRIHTSIPGIGPVTAAALICCMPELGTVTRRQAASLVGVAPMARDSGKSKGARHVRGGRRRPRDVLYMAAVSAMTWNPEMKAFCRRLIVIANALLRDRRLWTERVPRPPHPANQPAALAPVS